MKQKLLKLIKISLVSLIIVKQAFLPINVLAEQLIEEVETNNYKISITI